MEARHGVLILFAAPRIDHVRINRCPSRGFFGRLLRGLDVFSGSCRPGASSPCVAALTQSINEDFGSNSHLATPPTISIRGFSSHFTKCWTL